MWIDNESQTRFDNLFIDLDEPSQKEILDEIAYYDPNDNMNDLPEPVQWFNLVRNLTMTGYFTAEVGIRELGYKGNFPNVWDGVPQDVLDQYGLEYDKEWLDKLNPKTSEEELAIDNASELKENSRLGCQIDLIEELNGLTITIGPNKNQI